MKFLREYVFKNILWKCLSLVLAAFLWLVCINVVNPVVTRTFTNRLIIKNLDILEANGYVLLNKDELERQSITVSVRAPMDAFVNLSGEFLLPYIDISPINYLGDQAVGNTQPINIRVERVGFAAGSAFTDASVEAQPFTAYIALDKITEIAKPVSVNLTGQPADNYIAGAGVTSPDAIRIIGPSTQLNRISQVYIDVNLEGANADVVRTQSVRIIDIDRRDVTAQFRVDNRNVEVRVPIYMSGRLPLRQDIKGQTAPGYELESVTYDIEFAEVTGPEDIIKQTAFIQLPDLDITGLTESTVITTDIRPQLIDTPLSIAGGAAFEVNASVVITAHEERELMLLILEPNELTGLGEGLNFAPFRMSCTVRGLPQTMEAFDTERDLSVSVDVTGLPAGNHRLPVTVTLPEGVYLVDDIVLADIVIEESNEIE